MGKPFYPHVHVYRGDLEHLEMSAEIALYFEAEDMKEERYLEKINQYPDLDCEQQHKLSEKAKEGNRRAREALITSNLRLARSIALTFMRTAVLDDLIQQSTIGLITAVDRFQPEKGHLLTNYVEWYARREIYGFLEDTGKVVLDEWDSQLRKISFRVISEHLRKNGRVPTMEEILRRIGSPDYSLCDLYSLFENYHQGQSSTAHEDIERFELTGVDERIPRTLVMNDTRKIIEGHMQNLSVVEQIVITEMCYHGTSADIAYNRWGLNSTEGKILLRKGLRQLREGLSKDPASADLIEH